MATMLDIPMTKTRLLLFSLLVLVAACDPPLSAPAAAEASERATPPLKDAPSEAPAQSGSPAPRKETKRRPAAQVFDEAGNELAPLEDTVWQSNFEPEAPGFDCRYIPKGGTRVYMPEDGGPLLSCDHSAGDLYERVHLDAAGPAEIFSDVFDASCCAIDPLFKTGTTLRRGPFTCEALAGGIRCRRDDGYGFEIIGDGPARKIDK